jgi:N-acetylglucosaminyldiphosphoundecaprenol N-acetyl-beta-D-mannosaminyltransferase
VTRYRLFGVLVDALTMQETVDQCIRLVAQERFAQHVVLNAGKVVMMADHPKLAAVVSACDLVNADGQSVVWAGRMLGVPFPERVAGIDLMEELLAAAEERGLGVFFLGARSEVLDRFVRGVRARFPALVVSGYRDGYFDAGDDTQVARTVVASGARMLFVGISSPRKEYFLSEQASTLKGVFAMGVGGSFDVFAGETRRAPRWMQRTGLEWAYRLLQEPGRLHKRYLVGNTRFLLIAARDLIAGRRAETIE